MLLHGSRSSNHHRSFMGQCPLLVIALACVLWRLPSSPSKKRLEQGNIDSTSHERQKLARIDFLGAFLLAGSIVTLLLILDSGSKINSALNISVLVVLLGVLLASFGWVESRWASETIFPLSLLANRDVVTSYFIAALQVGAQCGVCVAWLQVSCEM
jgi:hypothetical protein